MCNKSIHLLAILCMGCSVTSAQVGGSIYPAHGAARKSSLYSDRVAAGVGDLITITVAVSTSASKTAQTKTAKTSAVADAIKTIVYPYNPNAVADRPNQGWTTPYNNAGDAPAMAWTGNQSFDGNGTLKQSETVTTTIQARVTEVLPNDTLRLEAKRIVETGKERADMTLTGLVRRDDLDSSNTVSSTKVADLQVKQEGTGPLSRQQRKGWMTTIYEFISPF